MAEKVAGALNGLEGEVSVGERHFNRFSKSNKGSTASNGGPSSSQVVWKGRCREQVRNGMVSAARAHLMEKSFRCLAFNYRKLKSEI